MPLHYNMGVVYSGELIAHPRVGLLDFVPIFYPCRQYNPNNSHVIDTQLMIEFMSYCSFANFVTLLISTERKHHICDIIVHNKLILTQSKRTMANNLHSKSYWYSH